MPVGRETRSTASHEEADITSKKAELKEVLSLLESAKEEKELWRGRREAREGVLRSLSGAREAAGGPFSGSANKPPPGGGGGVQGLLSGVTQANHAIGAYLNTYRDMAGGVRGTDAGGGKDAGGDSDVGGYWKGVAQWGRMRRAAGRDQSGRAAGAATGAYFDQMIGKSKDMLMQFGKRPEERGRGGEGSEGKGARGGEEAKVDGWGGGEKAEAEVEVEAEEQEGSVSGDGDWEGGELAGLGQDERVVTPDEKAKIEAEVLRAEMREHRKTDNRGNGSRTDNWVDDSRADNGAIASRTGNGGNGSSREYWNDARGAPEVIAGCERTEVNDEVGEQLDAAVDVQGGAGAQTVRDKGAGNSGGRGKKKGKKKA